MATAQWWIGANGVSVRVMDVSRAYTQRTIDFDLDRIEEDDRALRVLQRLFEGTIENPLSTLETLDRETPSSTGRRSAARCRPASKRR